MAYPSNLEHSLFTVKGLLRSSPIAWLKVTGPDAADFLQGQCTQDLRGLRDGQTTDALWLNTKGRILGESLILRAAAPAEDAWWLWSAHTAGASLRSRLEDFIIADDVTIIPEETVWEQVTLAGPAAEAWLRESLGGLAPPGPGTWLPLGGGFLFAGRRGLPRIWEWLRPMATTLTPPEPPATLGDLLPGTLHRARLAAGTPAIPGEFGPQDLPQEAGLETTAISFNKGCYLGQEVMARLHAMGQVRRRLLRVAGPGPAPAAPLEIRQNEKRVGELRASADDGEGGWIGLALLNLLGLDPALPLLTVDQRAVHAIDPLRT
jgi:tRNA-modifying protein YgfZ